MSIEVGELKLYEVEELADLLHIQERIIRKLIREGQLKARKLSRKWIFTEDSLKEYFSQIEPVTDRPVSPLFPAYGIKGIPNSPEGELG